MVINFLIFTLIVGALYVLAYPDSEAAATASAIRQIWSGRCCLNCRQSDTSGFSGLSGISPGFGDKYTAHSSRAEPSTGCVCETCPCALLDSVMTTCQPATRMYSGVIDVFASCFYTALQMLSDMYSYVERVLSCRASCQRTAQLIESQDSASDNIYFGDKKYNNDSKRTSNKDSAIRSSKSIIFKDVADDDKRTDAASTLPPESGSKSKATDMALKPKEKKSKDLKKPSEEIISCPKCVEQGKVCIGSCPKAVKKK